MSYCSIKDVRDEGFATCDFPDRRVQKAVRDATKFIDKVTGRWFEPRDLTVVIDWQGEKDISLEAPIIAIEELRFVFLDGTLGDPFTATDFVVYNRHVREGLITSRDDDREDPKIGFLFVRPNLLVPRVTPITLREVVTTRVQNIQIKGTFGYTEPTFGRARSIGTGVGDAITAPNTIKMVNANFDADDVGHTITLANTAGGTNDGNKTIIELVNAETVKIKETLATEVAGFTATIVEFPQVGIVPPDIARACLLIGIRNLPARATADPLATALSGGRVRRMSTRDQSVEVTRDTRLDGIGGGAITGDPEVDLVLIGYRRPPSIGRA